MDVSVVIPTYNRPRRLAACLESLTRQNFPAERFEVMVVDDGGDADLDSVVAPFRARLNISLLRQDNGGPASARNTGVRHASGAFIALTDDDCSLADDWIEYIFDNLQEDKETMYGGFSENALPGNLYSSASQALIDFLYAYYNADPDRARFLTSNNMAMSRLCFIDAGGFDESFPGACGEDREFCDRWLHQGRRIRLLHAARIFHSHDLTFSGFCRQHFNYGTGAAQYWQRRQQREQSGRSNEPLAFYLDLLGFAFKRRLPRALRVTGLLLLSQLANSAGYFYARVRRH